jgi:hypothetical protein
MLGTQKKAGRHHIAAQLFLYKENVTPAKAGVQCLKWILNKQFY